MDHLVPIKFLHDSGMYNAGEVAGFNPEVAERYVKAGHAERVSKQAELTADKQARPGRGVVDK